MKRILKEKGPIFSLLAVAALLRFWNIHTLEYQYDELSAVLRALGATNWKEHIQNGILPDGHPAGIQTLILLTGDHVTLLKSLAALAGTAAVYFIYRTGLILFQPAAAYTSAGLLAISYPALFWSQQIRPYAFGLCASTAFLWIAAQIVIQKKQHISIYILLGILAAINAYIHYFSGLFAFLVMVFVLILSAGKLKYNFISWILAFTLFLPHLPITIHQLNAGGLGWLAKPAISFFPDHVHQIFSNSGILMAIILIPAGTGILVLMRNKIKLPVIILLVLFTLFLLPLVIGYLYSIWRAPVLQHSVLLFSMPPLLLVLGYFISQLPANIFRTQIALILFCGIAAIIWGRKHYSIVYKEPYSSAVKFMVAHPEQRYAAYVPKDIFEYYIQKYNAAGMLHFRYIPDDEVASKLSHFANISDMQNETLILSSGSHPGIVPTYEDHTLSEKYSDPLYTWIGLEIPQFRNYAHDNRRMSDPDWPYTKIRIPAEIALKSLNPQPNDVIVIKYIPGQTLPVSGEIQTALHNGKKQIDWRSTPISRLNKQHYHFIKLADIPGWNQHTKLQIRTENSPPPGSFFIRISKGNPYLYGVR